MRCHLHFGAKTDQLLDFIFKKNKSVFDFFPKEMLEKVVIFRENVISFFSRSFWEHFEAVGAKRRGSKKWILEKSRIKRLQSRASQLTLKAPTVQLQPRDAGMCSFIMEQQILSELLTKNKFIKYSFVKKIMMLANSSFLGISQIRRLGIS